MDVTESLTFTLTNLVDGSDVRPLVPAFSWGIVALSRVCGLWFAIPLGDIVTLAVIGRFTKRTVEMGLVGRGSQQFMAWRV
jgi:hypothetical protein